MNVQRYRGTKLRFRFRRSASASKRASATTRGFRPEQIASRQFLVNLRGYEADCLRGKTLVNRHRRTLAVAILSVVAFSLPGYCHAQSGLRESLERLDTNENGLIDPDEVTPLARPYLERISNRSRVRLDRPTEIDVILETARIYYAMENGVGYRYIEPVAKSSVKEFGPDPNEPLIPQFGLGAIKYPYTQEDLDDADRLLYYYDRNRDGFLDERETQRANWRYTNPFDQDANKDRKLSRMELAQRYAQRRLVQRDTWDLFAKAYRSGGLIPEKDKAKKIDSNQWWREGGSAFWLTAAMIGRFDANKNGRLEASEAQNLSFPISQIDADKNGEITRDELFAFTSQLQNEAGDASIGLPGWFFERDEDEDGQISMREYATDWSAQQLDEFSGFDVNDDGLITQQEILQSNAAIGGTYSYDEAEIIPPRRTIVSEIEVTDDYIVSDLDVRLSITHTSVGELDAFLIGPDETRVELFTGIGGGGDHFDKTTFDNEAEGQPIHKNRAPFDGRYRPEEKDQGKPGLAAFYGKSIKGVWQLSVRATRSDRFGMLHSWGLDVKPSEDMPSATGIDPNDTKEDESKDGDDKKENDDKAENKDAENAEKSKEKKTGFNLKNIDMSDPEVRRKVEEWKRRKASERSKKSDR